MKRPPFEVGFALLLTLACAAAAPEPRTPQGPAMPLSPGNEEQMPSSAPPPLPAPALSGATDAASEAAVDSDEARRDFGDLPDPPPLAERSHWQYTITYDRGAISASEPRLSCFDHPVPAARKIGRFAFELWLGRELIERVRFDFPLLAAEVPRTGKRRELHEEPRFGPGARATVSLSIPASERATSARILDRATREVIGVPWPPPTSGNGEPCRPGAG